MGHNAASLGLAVSDILYEHSAM